MFRTVQNCSGGRLPRPSNRAVTVPVSTQRPAARAVGLCRTRWVGWTSAPTVPPGRSRRPHGPEPPPIPWERGSQAQLQRRQDHTRCATHLRRASSASAHPRPRWRSWKENRPGQSLRARGSPTRHGPEGKRSSAFKSEAVGEARGRNDTETFPARSWNGAPHGASGGGGGSDVRRCLTDTRDLLLPQQRAWGGGEAAKRKGRALRPDSGRRGAGLCLLSRPPSSGRLRARGADASSGRGEEPAC